MTQAAIELRDVWFRYGRNWTLEALNLNVIQNEFLGLIGPNASGKTTLLKLILGLLEPSKGEVRVLGTTPSKSRRKIGYVPQFAQFSRDFPATVLDTVLTGRLGQTRLIGGYTKEDKLIATNTLEELAIESLEKQHIGSLSGGQTQRVLIARALASKPDILILDEPTSNVDLRAEEDIFHLLSRLSKALTVIVVSHDVGFISEYVHRVACLNRTLVCHQTSDITGDKIQDLYGTPVRMVNHHHPDSSEHG